MQAVVDTYDVPVAIAVTLFFNQAAILVFLTVVDTVILNKLLPQIQALNSNLSKADLNQVRFIGLNQLITQDQIPELLIAYGTSLGAAFLVATALMVLAVLAAFGVEWKSLKSRGEVEKEE